MADNVAVTAGAGTSIAADDIGSVFYQRVKITWGVDGTANDASAANPLPVGGAQVTISTDATRAADTNTYAPNDAWSNSASAPTAGGYTFTGVGRVSGGSGIITDVVIATSNDPALLLQGEIWIFDTAPTAINDNAAFAVSDAEIKTCIGKIPFTLEDAGNNGFAHVTGLNIGFTTVGSANMRFLVKVKNAYIPANAEVLTVRLKIVQTD